ncbi:hypothetical protein [Deinococcus sp.]|uniref:hypothetical protein n=1 Tax=Deinococcus sp. TaxID=47478 RepID=UPI003C7B67B1
MNIRTFLLAVLMLFLPVAQVAQAQTAIPQTATPTANTSAEPVRVVLASLIVGKDAKGQETLTATSDSARPRPGDLLAWKAIAVNDLPRGVLNLALTIPIPASTAYIGGSAALKVGAQTISPIFSVDGQNFAPAPLKRRVNVVKDGVTTVQEVVVLPSEYRAVRWMLPTLAAKSQVVAEVRTSVR